MYYRGVSVSISIKINNAFTLPANITSITNYINPAIATNSLITDTVIPIMLPSSVVNIYGNTSPASNMENDMIMS